ncbi:hypothetical protein V6N13_080904 [Hibiscus sabdariffa]
MPNCKNQGQHPLLGTTQFRRNRWIHQNQLLPAKLVVDYAQLLVGEIQGLETTAPQPVSSNVATPQWTKPEQGR